MTWMDGEHDVKDAHEDPGAARRGNFKNYYRFNPPSERLSQVPKDLLAQLPKRRDGAAGGSDVRLALDVGCNSGDLTSALFDHLAQGGGGGGQKLKVLGIDLDPELVEVARRNHGRRDGSIEFAIADVTEQDDDGGVLRDFLSRNNASSFDVVFCFSVTMWIHLNHGDRGLETFVRFVSKIASRLVLEPQPWKCYRSASRRMRKLKQPHFRHLDEMANKSDDGLTDFIERTCAESGLEKLRVFGETTKWRRKITLFGNEVLHNKL